MKLKTLDFIMTSEKMFIFISIVLVVAIAFLLLGYVVGLVTSKKNKNK